MTIFVNSRPAGVGSVYFASTAAFGAMNAGPPYDGRIAWCPILGADGVTVVGYGYWAAIAQSTGSGPWSWQLVKCDMTGTDVNRPSCATLANGATFVGATYRPNNAPAIYECLEAGVWIVKPSGPDRCTIANFTVNNSGFHIDTSSATSVPVEPDLANLSVHACTFYLYRQPTVGQYIFSAFDAGGAARGYAVITGRVAGVARDNIEVAAFGLVGFYVPICSVAGLYNRINSVVIARRGNNFRVSLNGGAPIITATVGAYVSRNANDPMCIGSYQAGTAPCVDLEWMSEYHWSGCVDSDAGLDAAIQAMSAELVATGRHTTVPGPAAVPRLIANANLWTPGAMGMLTGPGNLHWRCGPTTAYVYHWKQVR